MKGFHSLCALTLTTFSASAFVPRSSYRPALSTFMGSSASSSTIANKPTPTSLHMSAQDFANKEIADNKVVIFR